MERKLLGVPCGESFQSLGSGFSNVLLTGGGCTVVADWLDQEHKARPFPPGGAMMAKEELPSFAPNV